MRRGKANKTERRPGWWAKLSLFCLKYWPLVLLGWLAVLGSCAYIYTQLIAKEGFPAISEPTILVSASYLSDNSEENDQLIAQPLHEIIGENVSNIRYSQMTSTSHGVNGFVYLEGKSKPRRASGQYNKPWRTAGINCRKTWKSKSKSSVSPNIWNHMTCC